jgi:hypothetical protein
MLLLTAAYAQTGEIKGSVKDSFSGEPLPHTNIIVLKGGLEKADVSTDIDGNYKVNPIGAGIYDLKVAFVGYAPRVIKNIKVDSATVTIVNIKLFQSGLDLKEVEIASYAKPLVMADEGSSARIKGDGIRKAPTRSVKSSSDKSPELSIVSDKVPDPENRPNDQGNLAGILTAGLLNDFSKWELWQDVNNGDLKTWQDYWVFKPFERYTLQVISSNGRPMSDCEVSLLNKDKNIEWTSRTDNTGKAELWANIYTNNNNKKGYSININYKGKNFNIDKILKFSDGINIITLPAPCEILQKADIMFVVDATGSMGDEIQYLKSELNNIIVGVKKQNLLLDLNLGSVFYRDNGDEYITRKSDFSPNINSTIDFIKQQKANGGGDEPEAVHTALNIAINNMKWSDTAVARLLFLVLDAPPHYTPGIIDSIQILIKEAAAKGIRIIPITGSGIDKSAEYLMRAFALATNGTYVFLTDHSNVGNPHIKPTTDEYDVELLKDVLLRILSQYLFVPSCTDKPDFADQQITDTMYVNNPKIIAHEIADSSLVGKYTLQISYSDTNRVSFIDPSQLIDVTNLIKDSSVFIIDLDNHPFTNFRYYPNPTSGRLNIDIKGKIDELYLADISGKLLERYQVKERENLEINISKYPVGVYFLQYFFENKWLTGKVILTH